MDSPPGNPFPQMSPGIDLVDVPRLAAAMGRGGTRFLRRVFTEAETAYCQSHRVPAPHFAARFAAKEAVAKALGTGIGESAAFKEIEVIRAVTGAPSIRLHGSAAATAAGQGVVAIQVSLSHTEDAAAAMVLISREKTPSPN